MKKLPSFGFALLLVWALTPWAPSLAAAEAAQLTNIVWLAEPAERAGHAELVEPTEHTIATATELQALAVSTNAGNSHAGEYFVLISDIDLKEAPWTPLGSYSSSAAAQKPFAGTFDGAGHTIRGLSISSGSGVALFGYLTGEVKNLTVEGSVAGGEVVAGVVANLGGTISGVVNRVSVAATGSYVGGIAANATSGAPFALRDCRNEGSITNSSATESSGKLGGILGRADSNTTGVIERCANTGSVHGYQYLGGIIGGVFGAVSVRSCFNSGAIEGRSFGKLYIGGIAGKLENGTIDSCYNRGTVYDNRDNTAMGHIRAVGGIVGCEENHSPGLAITNVYQAGLIAVNTAGMNPADENQYIMMTGHISGGNSSTDANTMQYENCFYELGCYPQAVSTHPDWAFFRHAEGLALWDTPLITGVPAAELRGGAPLAVLGSAFAADEHDINDGYPVLAWQNGNETTPQAYAVRDLAVFGGTALVSASAAQATEGSTIAITVNNLEPGKRVYRVAATDVSGADVPVTAMGEGEYCFAMPARAVSVEVLLEAAVDEGARYALTLQPLDAVWALAATSSSVNEQGFVEGCTVFVTVALNANALTTKLTGLVIETTEGVSTPQPVQLRPGLYSFSMPASAANLALEAEYAPLSVYCLDAGAREANLVQAYSRAQMQELAVHDVYYSGWATEIEPFIGHAESAVELSTLLAVAQIPFEAGDVLKVTGIDGFSLLYSYEELMLTPRSYYPKLFEGSSAGGVLLASPLLTITNNTVVRSAAAGAEPLPGNTQSTYRFVFGQSEAEFAGSVKVTDRMLKCVTGITVLRAAHEQAGLPGSGDVDGDGYITAADALQTLRVAARLVSLSPAQLAAADRDGDGFITAADAMSTLRAAAGLGQR